MDKISAKAMISQISGNNILLEAQSQLYQRWGTAYVQYKEFEEKILCVENKYPQCGLNK